LPVAALLKGLPDLSRGLARIQYGRATPAELASFLRSFNRVATAFQPFNLPIHVGFRSTSLNMIVWTLPRLKAQVQTLINAVKLSELDAGRKAEMWVDEERWPQIEQAAMVSSGVDPDKT
jgi:DNA mismatch repair protein MSH3